MMKVYRSNLSLIRKNINPETLNMNYMHKDGGNIHGMKRCKNELERQNQLGAGLPTAHCRFLCL